MVEWYKCKKITITTAVVPEMQILVLTIAQCYSSRGLELFSSNIFWKTELKLECFGLTNQHF